MSFDAALYSSNQILPLLPHLSHPDFKYDQKVFPWTPNREVCIEFPLRGDWVPVHVIARRGFIISHVLATKVSVDKSICNPSRLVRPADDKRDLGFIYAVFSPIFGVGRLYF